MDENRKTGILSFGVVLLILGFSVAIIHHPPSFYLGLPIGFIFGVATCFYLAEAWDPYLLEPTNPNTKKASMARLWWVVPLGVLAANILSKFLGETLNQLLLGCILGWLFVTLGYFIIQAWRYR